MDIIDRDQRLEEIQREYVDFLDDMVYKFILVILVIT